MISLFFRATFNVWRHYAKFSTCSYEGAMPSVIRFAINYSLGLVLLGSLYCCVAFGQTLPCKASRLPFPPDAQNLRFQTTVGDISYSSNTSLFALADFYRRALTDRGWKEDLDAVEFDNDEITMVFKHGDAKVKIELDKRSRNVDVCLDCDGIDFTGADDPAALLAAGVPQPRSSLFLQQSIALPAEIRDLTFSGDEMSFKSRMKLTEAFAHFCDQIKKLGFSESRKPIISGDRNYTEFRKGPIALRLNIFTHDYGTRLHISYESTEKQQAVAPLPDVATFAMPGGRNVGISGHTAEEIKAIAAARKPVDNTHNTGKVVITHGREKYTFTHVAAYQSGHSGNDDKETHLVFANKPLPFNKMQQMLIDKENFFFGDLYEFDMPSYITMHITSTPSFSFSVPGVSIGDSMDDPQVDAQYEEGRIKAKIKMLGKNIFDEPFSFEAQIDAALISRDTRLADSTDPVEASRLTKMDGTDSIPMPSEVSDSFSEGLPYRKTIHAKLALSFDQITAFYRQKLPGEGWRENSAGNDMLSFRKGDDTITVSKHKPDAAGFTFSVTKTDGAKARADGILPEHGKGRLIMGNAHTQPVVITIGQQNYTLKPGQGAKNPKSALNYTVTPATYPLVIKIPGEASLTEEVKIKPDTTWGVIALPTGGCVVNQLY